LAGGANHVDLGPSTGAHVWPVGWRAGQLVVASGSAATQNLASNPYGTFSGYQVLDPSSGARQSSIDCMPAGPLTPAGTACLGGAFPLVTMDFAGNPRRLADALAGAILGAALSPDGAHAIFCCGAGQLQLWDTVTGATSPLGAVAGPNDGWI